MPICNVKLFYFPQLTLHIISAYMNITSEETVVSVYMCVQSLGHVQLFCDLMDCNPPGSSVLEFSRQAYWTGLPLPYFRGSPQPRDWTCISCTSCIGRWILYHCVTWESQKNRKQVTIQNLFVQSVEISVFSYIHTACQIKIYDFFEKLYHTVFVIFWKFELLAQPETLSSSRVVTGHENVKMSTETLSVECPFFLKINQNKKKKGIFKKFIKGLKRFSFLSLKKYTGKAIARRDLGRTFVQMTFWNVVLEEWRVLCSYKEIREIYVHISSYLNIIYN